MSFSRPNLLTLIERAIADIESRLSGASARLRRSNLNVLARVHAGATHGLYGYLDWIAKQILPDQADAEILERHAGIWLTTGRIPASYASGPLTVSGTSGRVVAAGTVFKRADGTTYSVETEVTLTASTATVTVVADEAGQDGNTDEGTSLTLDSPIDGIEATATVAADGLTGGADVEDHDSLRARVLDRIKNPPMGGAKADYVTWAKEVSGVTRAWCYPLEQGDGSVTVRFVRDDDANLIPDASEVAVVQAYIDARRPITADLVVVAPVAAPQAFVIAATPATTAVKAAIEANLRDLLLREAVPEGGSGEGTILLSHMREAISLASGETDNTLVSPAANLCETSRMMANSLTYVSRQPRAPHVQTGPATSRHM